MKWHILKENDNSLYDYSQKEICRPIAMSLYNRNIIAENVDSFFKSSLNNLSNPFDLSNMKKTVKRLWKAIFHKEKIFIHGDYDTDGVSAAVLLHWVLYSYGADVEVFVANRLEYGYGPTIPTMQHLHKQNAKVVVSVDCGINAFEAAQEAKKLNIDFLITDHHTPSATLPESYSIVNPYLNKELSHLHNLAGVGVAFKVAHAFILYGKKFGYENPVVDLRLALDLVALGTISDTCPLIGENRILVKNGLKLIKLNKRVGLRALYDLSRVDLITIDPTDISRKITPKLNAAGRVGSPEIAVKLLQENNLSKAYLYAKNLEQFNIRRRQKEMKAYKEAIALINDQLQEEDRAIVVYGKNWHPGIVGLLATKISRKFNVPAIILSDDELSSEMLGSGRSHNNKNVLQALNTCKELLTSFGGHPSAVGLSLHKDDFPVFKQHILSYFANASNNEVIEEILMIDGRISLHDINKDFFKQYSLLAPFGRQWKEPLYCIKNINAINIRRFSNVHVQGRLVENETSISFVYYNAQENLPKMPWDVVITPKVHRKKNNISYQLIITDIKSHE